MNMKKKCSAPSAISHQPDGSVEAGVSPRLVAVKWLGEGALEEVHHGLRCKIDVRGQLPLQATVQHMSRRPD